jgi:hypothetical protein
MFLILDTITPVVNLTIDGNGQRPETVPIVSLSCISIISARPPITAEIALFHVV